MFGEKIPESAEAWAACLDPYASGEIVSPTGHRECELAVQAVRFNLFEYRNFLADLMTAIQFDYLDPEHPFVKVIQELHQDFPLVIMDGMEDFQFDCRGTHLFEGSYKTGIQRHSTIEFHTDESNRLPFQLNTSRTGRLAPTMYSTKAAVIRAQHAGLETVGRVGGRLLPDHFYNVLKPILDHLVLLDDSEIAKKFYNEHVVKLWKCFKKSDPFTLMGYWAWLEKIQYQMMDDVRDVSETDASVSKQALSVRFPKEVAWGQRWVCGSHELVHAVDTRDFDYLDLDRKEYPQGGYVKRMDGPADADFLAASWFRLRNGKRLKAFVNSLR